MNKLFFCLILSLLLSPLFLSGQSIYGSWAMEGTTSDGETVTNTVSFMENGQMTVDFGSDGSVDVEAAFTLDGNQISISDSNEESPCYNKIGIYAFSIDGKTMTAEVVEDPCDERRGDGKAGTMTRVD